MYKFHQRDLSPNTILNKTKQGPAPPPPKGTRNTQINCKAYANHQPREARRPKLVTPQNEEKVLTEHPGWNSTNILINI